jgi:hypothetical protein
VTTRILSSWLGISVVILFTAHASYSQSVEAGGEQSPTSQETPRLVPPPCNSYIMEKEQKLTFRQKFCYYANNKVLTGSAIFGGLFFSGVAQARRDPKEWEQGVEGYARRFGSRYAQGPRTNQKHGGVPGRRDQSRRSALASAKRGQARK